MRAAKVAIITTHPIQYQVPWFQKLAEQVELTVYYALLPDAEQQGVGFGVAFKWDIPMLEGYEWRVIPNKRTSPSLRGFFASSTPAIYSLLSETNPDVVIITGWHALPLLQALWACIRLGIPRIVRGESNGLRKRAYRTRVLHRLLLSWFEAFLAIGQANRDFYLQYGINPERIFVGNYFIDNHRFREQLRQIPDVQLAIRSGWGIPEEAVCFVYVGKLEPKKRIMDLLRAVDRAHRINSSIHLLVVGDGELMTEARQMVAGLGLPVTFAGFLNQREITRAYMAADCLVLPSDFGETWGLVVNEAMACGLPALVSDQVGCGTDLVKEGRTGMVFRCGDIDALTGKLLELSSDPARLARMGAQASEHISQYSVEQAVAGTVSAIDFVLQRESQ
ncbi:MAG: glycosyltransferase family 4 protein [Blastocatellia bacterium]